MIDDRLHPVAPGGLQHLGIQQDVRQLAEQVGADPAAGGDVAIHAHEDEALILDGEATAFDHVAHLVLLEVAVERGLGDLGLALLVVDAREQANLP